MTTKPVQDQTSLNVASGFNAASLFNLPPRSPLDGLELKDDPNRTTVVPLNRDVAFERLGSQLRRYREVDASLWAAGLKHLTVMPTTIVIDSMAMLEEPRRPIVGAGAPHQHKLFEAVQSHDDNAIRGPTGTAYKKRTSKSRKRR